MNQRATDLRNTIFELQTQLQAAESALIDLTKACEHRWAEPQLCRGGSKHRYTPEPEWSRECSECGLVETTRKFTTSTIKHPEFTDCKEPS